MVETTTRADGSAVVQNGELRIIGGVIDDGQMMATKVPSTDSKKSIV
jgi:hypothetical protein